MRTVNVKVTMPRAVCSSFNWLRIILKSDVLFFNLVLASFKFSSTSLSKWLNADWTSNLRWRLFDQSGARKRRRYSLSSVSSGEVFKPGICFLLWSLFCWLCRYDTQSQEGPLCRLCRASSWGSDRFWRSPPVALPRTTTLRSYPPCCARWRQRRWQERSRRRMTLLSSRASLLTRNCLNTTLVVSCLGWSTTALPSCSSRPPTSAWCPPWIRNSHSQRLVC